MQGEVEHFKARYIAKGLSKVKGLDYDEKCAPVAQFDSLKFLLAIATQNR